MSRRPQPESEKPIRGPLQSLDLEAEASRLRGEREWREGRPKAIMLHKGAGIVGQGGLDA